MDIFNVVAGIATLLALAIAVWQTADVRIKSRIESERIALQRTRISNAAVAAISSAEAANLAVQRSKDPDVEPKELQNIARIVRGNLLLLARQLEQEEEMLRTWEFGRSATLSEAPTPED